MRDTIEVMLKSSRVHTLNSVIETLKSNPYLKKEEAQALRKESRRRPPSASVETVTPADSEKAFIRGACTASQYLPIPAVPRTIKLFTLT